VALRRPALAVVEDGHAGVVVGHHDPAGGQSEIIAVARGVVHADLDRLAGVADVDHREPASPGSQIRPGS